MRKRFFILGIFILAMGLGFVFSGLYQAAAVDSPHNLEGGGTSLASSPNGCTQTCHKLHNASGGSLNKALGNVDLCVTCHTTPNTFVLPGSTANITSPGTVGIHHRYKVPYNNTAMNTTSPRPYFTFATLEDNGTTIVCSSCHEVHAVDIDRTTTNTHTGVNYGNQKTSVPPGGGAGSLVTKTTGLANQQLYVNTIAANAAAKSYKIKIVQGGVVGVATFIVSYDGGLSWFNWNGINWIAGTSAGPGRATAASVAPDNSGNVTVKFSIVSGTYAVNDQWATFYVSYPFLRGALDSGDNSTGAKFCRNCHGNWVNTYQQVEGPPAIPGTTKFSHPVGQALNANGKSYDRAVPLDVNGQPQGASSDTNASNDLRRDASGNVQCYSCHNIHFGDSNSLSQDSPM